MQNLCRIQVNNGLDEVMEGNTRDWPELCDDITIANMVGYPNKADSCNNKTGWQNINAPYLQGRGRRFESRIAHSIDLLAKS